MYECKSTKDIVLIPTHSQNEFKIQLGLDKECVGMYDNTGEGTLHLKRSHQDLFSRTCSLGVNLSLLANFPQQYMWIVIYYSGKKLYSSRNFFLFKGYTYQFANQGFEPENYVCIKQLNLPTAKRFEEYLATNANAMTKMAGRIR